MKIFKIILALQIVNMVFSHSIQLENFECPSYESDGEGNATSTILNESKCAMTH